MKIWACKAILIAVVFIALYLTLLIGVSYLIFVEGEGSTFATLLITLHVVVCNLLARYMIVHCKISMVTSTARLIFLEVCHKQMLRDAVATARNAAIIAPRIRLNSFAVQLHDTYTLRSLWFWRVPKHFSYAGVSFRWSWNPKKMIDEIYEPVMRVYEDAAVLDSLTFEFTEHAQSVDTFALGHSAFVTIQEAFLNDKVPNSDWAFYLDHSAIRVKRKA